MNSFDYDSIPAGYYDLVYKKQYGIQSKWHQLKFRFFKEHLQPDDSILDIGCGPGTFLGNISDYKTATGIDLSAPQIEYAQQNYARAGLNFLTFDGSRIPLPDNSFDVVTLIEVIEHVPPATVAHLFAEAKRVLKPGGRFYVSTPNYGSLWPLLEKVLNAKAEVTYEEQHINLFKRDRLQAELEASGYDNVTVRAYQFLAPFMATLNGRLANQCYSLEKGSLSSRIGFLLFASASKG